ncbi:MAG: hypothetical protein ABIT36_01265 [Steroidobacteraceae bacterium]
MKTVVSVQEISELEIKPAAEVARWRELVTQELAARWKVHSLPATAGCPCCATQAVMPAFVRDGFEYGECTACGTLYALRRPSDAEVARWYRESPPARFWRETLLTTAAAARHEQLILPRAQWVLDTIAEHAPLATSLLDVSVHGVALLEELALAQRLKQIVAAGWTADLETRSAASGTSIEIGAGKNGARFDVAMAHDIFDRTSDLRALVQSLHGSLHTGGLLFFTLPLGSGFEIQTLWDRSRTVVPPDKLNLASGKGLLKLFSAPDWELLEFSTPGYFDAEIVYLALRESPAAWPRSVRTLLQDSTPDSRARFAELLQASRLTSFARLVARRSN